MKSKLRKFAATAIVAGSAFAATAANATPPPGSNNGPDHIRSAGSDTTYDMMSRLNALYNASVGCSLNLAAPDYGDTCASPAAGTETENYDHDTVVEDYGIGSSNGINVAHATIAGLKSLRKPEELAELRGKAMDQVVPSGTLRAYRERQREQDLFKTEEK